MGVRMARHLFLVRHGETMFNAKRIIQGWCDSPLTDTGRAQASRVGGYFARKGITFDHAYASPSGRTRETIECITSMPYTPDDRLRELFFGAYEGERDCVIPPMPWDSFFVPFGGESLQDLQERMSDALGEIMARPGHERVLAVSHGTASQMFLARWRDQGRCGSQGLPGNCSIMHLEFDGNGFHLLEVVEQEAMKRLLEE